MKTGSTRLMVLALALTGGWGPGTFNVAANLEVSAAVQINAAMDFYEPLAPEGAWVEVDHYGRCWHPARVAVGWRPYCDGTWVWTDCGWYWQSDEPWAWACYHYGSWVYDPRYGWVWVPGVEWAPAWVYWRTGDGYIGWAPCSPRGGVVVSGAFVFVDEHHFQERHRPTTVIVNNVTIIDHTRPITGSRRESRDIGGRRQTVVINGGPDVNVVEKATGRKFTAVSVREADLHTLVPPSVRHRQSESPGETKKPAVQGQAWPAPEHHLSPGEMPEHPVKPVPPAGPPPKHKITPPPQPPEPEVPPAGPDEKNHPGPGHGEDKDKGHQGPP